MKQVNILFSLFILLFIACDNNSKILKPLWINSSGNYDPNDCDSLEFIKIGINNELFSIMKSHVVKKEENVYLIRGVDAKKEDVSNAGHKIYYSTLKKEIYIFTIMSGMDFKDMFNSVFEVKTKIDLSSYKVYYISAQIPKR